MEIFKMRAFGSLLDPREESNPMIRWSSSVEEKSNIGRTLQCIFYSYDFFIYLIPDPSFLATSVTKFNKAEPVCKIITVAQYYYFP